MRQLELVWSLAGFSPCEGVQRIERRMEKHAHGKIAAPQAQNGDDRSGQSGIDQLKRPFLVDIMSQRKGQDGRRRCNPAAADQFSKLLDDEPSVDKLLKR